MPTGYLTERRSGGRWVQGTPLADLQARTMRDNNQLGGLTIQVFHGYETWFCEFNEGHQFTISAPTGFPGAHGSVLDAESIPSGNATVNATAPNVDHPTYWARSNVGFPVDYQFNSDAVVGVDNELHSSVKLGTSTVNAGFFAYQPWFNIGWSAGNSQKEFGWAARIRKQSGAIPTGAGFFGLASMFVGSVPLTTTGTLAAVALTDWYYGFYVDTANKIWAVMNNEAANQTLIDTGFSLSSASVFTTLEMRSFFDGGGGAGWATGSYIDLFINGSPIIVNGKPHTFTPADTAWSLLGPTGLCPTMGVVKTSGAQVTPIFQVDHMGAWHSRQVHIGSGL